MIESPVIGIVGSQGAYGRWLTRFFRERMGLRVVGRDPVGDLDLSEVSLIAASDVLIFSAPIRHTAALIAHYVALAAGSEREQLWLDVTSIKREPVAAMLESTADVVGLHPMCAPPRAPTLRGRVMVVCEARLTRWRGFVEKLLSALEAECVHAGAQAHDQRMALVQAMVHAVHLAQAAVLRDCAPDVNQPSDVMPYRSVSFELDMTIAARVLASNPAIYEDIQFGNPAVLPMLDKLLLALTTLRDCVRAGDEAGRERFRSAFFESGRAFFGERALREGNHGFERLGYLLADLNDRRVLDIHLLDDQPGALRALLALMEMHQINLRSIHSSRTPTGEVHFRIGCDDDSDPALLQHIASEIERTGLGRTVTC
ncbi:MAG: prephenate dehydrogenase [Pseudomarimonas sp.]